MCDYKIDYVSIGKKIKKKRLERSLTQEQLGELVNLSTPHISHIENGNTKLSLESLIRIMNALQTSAGELLSDNLQYNDAYYNNEIMLIMEDCSREEKQDLVRIARYFKDFFRSRDKRKG